MKPPFLKRVLISKHIIEEKAIEPSVFEFSTHERIIIRVNGGDLKAQFNAMLCGMIAVFFLGLARFILKPKSNKNWKLEALTLAL